MVKHIVLFKLKNNSKEHCEFVRDMILSLKEKIEEIKEYEVGINFSKEQRAYDLALISSFEDEEALKRYAKHPLHLRVVEYLKSKESLTKVVDYFV